jgi:hypothetical protein
VYKIEEDDKVPFRVYLTTPFQLNWLRNDQIRTCFMDFKMTPLNPLTPNNLYGRRAVSPLKIKIPSKNTPEKPPNTQTIHSVY